MAGWNDLPPELKEMVVKMVDDDEVVRSGELTSGEETFDALLALSSMDRELHALVASVLWHTVPLREKSPSRIEGFVSEVAPRKGRFARHLILYHPVMTTKRLAQTYGTYSALFESVPNLDTLQLRCRSSFLVGILPLFPPRLSATLKRIDLDGPNNSPHKPVHVAAFLHALPQLVQVELRGVGSAEGAALAIRALRHLPKLQKLKMQDGIALVHHSLGEPWASSLTSLNLDQSETIDLAVLQALLERHSNTLRQLSLPFLSQHSIFPAFSLPQLADLWTWTCATSAKFPLSFSKSPLRVLRVKMYVEDDPIKPGLEAVLETVQQHLATLQRVRLSAYSFKTPERDEYELLDKLEALCLGQGIMYEMYFELP